VLAQLAQSLQGNGRNARLQVEQTEILSMLLFEHVKQVRLMAICAFIAVLIVQEQVIDFRLVLLSGQDCSQNSLRYITQLVFGRCFRSIALHAEAEEEKRELLLGNSKISLRVFS
jgi:uncharacterized membrane protein